MKELLSYEQLAWIVEVQFVVLFILLILILKRKIGRPLTETELEEKRQQKEKKRLALQEIERQNQLENQKKIREIKEQEEEIRSLLRPVIFVSLNGDDLRGRTLCVQDGKGDMHSFHASDYDLENNARLFNGLYQASREPNYYGKIGAVLLH